MRILYWTTSLNGELLAHLRHTLAQGRHEALVAYDHYESFRQEACSALWPLDVRVIPRSGWRSHLELQRFRADVVIVDNHLPPVPVARRLFVIWHGFGWKGPQDRAEFATFYRQAGRLVGPIDRPNPRFTWKAYGPLDHEQRISRMELDPANVRSLGMAAADDFFHRAITPEAVAPFYPFDVQKPVVLFAPTWHYNEVFGHWEGDREVFEKLAALLRERGASMIVRMHDRKRYSPEYSRMVDDWTRGRPDIMIKYKDEYTDNTVDMLLASVLITNYSSIANPFYASLKPTVHVYPVAGGDGDVRWRRLRSDGVEAHEHISRELLWKLDLMDNGGSVAKSSGELLTQLGHALDHPDCHARQARDFLDRHIDRCDGRTCERITEFLEETSAPCRVFPVVQVFTPPVAAELARQAKCAVTSRRAGPRGKNP